VRAAEVRLVIRSQRLRIAVLAFSEIRRDTRVLRTIAALADMGHEVIAIGYGDAPVRHTSDFVQLPEPASGWRNRVAMALTRAPSNFAPRSADFLHNILAHHRAARDALLTLRPNVVHANDWPALPAAAFAKATIGCKVIYDSHEFATEEHAHSLVWRFLGQNYVRAIEGQHIQAADRIITVSAGISDALAALYRLPVPPLVVRNVPAYEEHPFRPVGHPRRLLFHGLLKPDRGIEELIKATRDLEDHVLVLRGEGKAAYVDHLLALVESIGVRDRVSIVPAVSPGEVVAQAAKSDIGIFAAPIRSAHNQFALPNKVFEYLMAGLAVVVMDGNDLASVIRDYHCGWVVDMRQPRALQTCLSKATAAEVEARKRNALQAARTLNWQEEQSKLAHAYQNLT